MIAEYFSVYDSAARMYLEPFACRTKEEAIRRFRLSVNSEGSGMARFPDDYTLFYIGGFDQESGLFQPVLTPESLGGALMYMESQHGGNGHG